MIALDTNILVYAHRTDSPHHPAAVGALRDLVENGTAIAIPWPVVHEFLAIVTHPRIYDPPSTSAQAWQAVADLTGAASVQLLGEGRDHLERLGTLLRSVAVVGPKVHDARVAAICLSHGISELWTADRDFSYFPALRTRNPLVT